MVRDYQSGTIVVNNYNKGTMSSADGDAFRPGMNTTVNNSGTITAGGAGNASGNDGLDLKTATGIVINNNATACPEVAARRSAVKVSGRA